MARIAVDNIEPRCTLEELQGVLPFFNLSEEAVRRVRQVLVEGIAPRVVAQTEGVSVSQVHRQFTKVLKKIEEMREGVELMPARRGRPSRDAETAAAPALAPNTGMIVPPGWETVCIVAPKDFVAKVRQELAELVSKGG